MIKKILLILILSIATSCIAQSLYYKASVSLVLPTRRSFINGEICNKLNSNFSIGLAAEISKQESNIIPKLIVDANSFSFDAGIGWCHIWQKDDIDDHNFHTYTIGAYWNKQITNKHYFYIGSSMFWRSYQGHIGFHKGTIRIISGLIITI